MSTVDWKLLLIIGLSFLIGYLVRGIRAVRDQQRAK